MNCGEMLVLLLQSDEAKVTSMSVDPRLDIQSCVVDGTQGVVQVHPSAQCPSFLKQLLKSHLSGKFYLGLPKKFCDVHLPDHDDTVVMVDEDAREYHTRYSVRKNRISGGWRVFSNAHKLLEGDTLVFHLIDHCRFKVHVVRAGKLRENDGDMVFQMSESKNPSPIVIAEEKLEEGVHAGRATKRVHPDSFAVDNLKETRRTWLVSDNNLANIHSGNSNDESSPSMIQSIDGTTPDSKFKDIRNFEAFIIKVDGFILDSKIPINIKTRYYHLCCSQKMFLHDHLIRGLSRNLAVTMIIETVSIADAIRSSNLTISLYHLECWDKTLKAFMDLGMEVAFLRGRLHKLISLSHEYLSNVETRKAKIVQADEEMSSVETSCNQKALAKNLESEVKSLILKNDVLGLEYQQVAGAPW